MALLPSCRQGHWTALTGLFGPEGLVTDGASLPPGAADWLEATSWLHFGWLFFFVFDILLLLLWVAIIVF
jgi:hypothetical protein